ncbi:hypothetical protein GUITHDRAFT_158817 [Guillardia theta CCMP2712]|uniref:P-type Ca(2+) transporter n=1 Tax=Guillardia theta (strain CCMP2712) TaxID=905079 RepID=L1IDZ6_GUITC|nr:hypothetical protein GUITHDRAFT_158817 [Guillardia theta CCMP2712]EKX34453.1 hypothetical protein GUITHDRAFT_158817 [Guillardia theta CCMP2712]|eukprot:XP_005821433.1 hypothetical protein GUITHDRAFT_158817 [Guillardia theta CCMP2712]
MLYLKVLASNCLEELNFDTDHGLSNKEVVSLREKFGKNELPKGEGEPLWKLFLKQFDDPLVKILLGAAAVSLVSSFIEGTSEGLIEFFVIMTILIFNAAVGVWQEKRAEDAIDALQSYNPEKAKVLRNGKLSEILSADIVPMDVVEVAVGDKVPADMRVIAMHSTTLKVEQAALTGESASVNKNPNSVSSKKDCELQAKDNILFSGTDVVYGKCRGVVILTGEKTEIGKIAKSLSETEEHSSPLKEKLDAFGDLLTNVITVICILCWVVNIFSFKRKGTMVVTSTFRDSDYGYLWCWLFGALFYFKEAVALAVAAIPEGLPAVVTTCLALGTRRMAKRNALIRHLPAVETLGCTSVICSDKTGTLTTNQMSVEKVLTFGKNSTDLVEMDVSGITYEPKGEVTRDGRRVTMRDHDVLSYLSKIMSLCNQSNISCNSAGHWDKIGESTEASLKVLVEKLADPSMLGSSGSHTPGNDMWTKMFKREATLEFARDRKSMSVIVDGVQLLCKGAPESVLARCTSAMMANGDIVQMTDRMREAIMSKVEKEYGSDTKALRCLAHAFSQKVELSDKRLADPKSFASVESNMTFVGVVGIRDPPRKEVKDSIMTCKKAGIRVIVITGDNQKTAEAVCRMIGVFEPDEDVHGKSLTGAEFARMSRREQLQAVMNASLFSRTEPIHKQVIVECLQTREAEGGPGEVAAMTGDGVNDAPALHAADIGVAMGSGTAVAQGAAKMVLADDNFTTIVAAIEEGRAIYNNTKAFIRYLISSNIGEVVCIFLAVLLGIPEVLVPVTLLWVNLVTDGLPATALSFNPPETDIMTKKPRKRDEQLLSAWILVRYVVIGAYVGIACILGFIWWQTTYEHGPKMQFAQLRDHLQCHDKNFKFANGFDCHVMEDKRPKTVSLSILVVVEMFNALNAISENESLLMMPPWVNPWLLATILLSMTQHFIILAVPQFRTIFQVAHLNQEEWTMVVLLSFPVILLDEVMKMISRRHEKMKEEEDKKFV